MEFLGLIERRINDIIAFSAFRTILFEMSLRQPMHNSNAVFYTIIDFLVIAIAACLDVTYFTTRATHAVQCGNSQSI